MNFLLDYRKERTFRITLLWSKAAVVEIKSKLSLPAGIVILFTLEYSATTYLHAPSFRDKDFLPFHALAALDRDALLSFLDNTFFTFLA